MRECKNLPGKLRAFGGTGCSGGFRPLFSSADNPGIDRSRPWNDLPGGQFQELQEREEGEPAMNVKRVAILGFALSLMLSCAPAQAGWHIGIGIGFPVCHHPHFGVFIAPAPVYVQPVYVQPAYAPVYVQPAPVYVPAQPVYVPAQPAPAVRPTYSSPATQSNYQPAASQPAGLPAQPVPVQQ